MYKNRILKNGGGIFNWREDVYLITPYRSQWHIVSIFIYLEYHNTKSIFTRPIIPSLQEESLSLEDA